MLLVGCLGFGQLDHKRLFIDRSTKVTRNLTSNAEHRFNAGFARFSYFKFKRSKEYIGLALSGEAVLASTTKAIGLPVGLEPVIVEAVV